MKQHTPNASPLNLTFALTCGLILLTMGLTACDKPGPAQEAGRHIDEAAEQASRTVQQKLTQAKVMNQSDIKQVDAAVSDADITAKVKLALMMRDGLNLSLLQKGT
jgi:hyperosmotically inducible protein